MKKIIKILLYKYYEKIFKDIGVDTNINPTASMHKKNLISIGRNSFIGKWCHVSVVEPARLLIGNFVIISPYTKILAGDHRIDFVGKPMIDVKDPINSSITIEDDIWIGMDSMILKGVRIGEGAVVGARSLVVKNILPYTIAVGIPAKMVKLRFDLNKIPFHLKTLNSRYDFEELKEAYRKENLI